MEEVALTLVSFYGKVVLVPETKTLINNEREKLVKFTTHNLRKGYSEMKNKNGKCITKLFDNSDRKFTQGVLWSIL